MPQRSAKLILATAALLLLLLALVGWPSTEERLGQRAAVQPPQQAQHDFRRPLVRLPKNELSLRKEASPMEFSFPDGVVRFDSVGVGSQYHRAAQLVDADCSGYRRLGAEFSVCYVGPFVPRSPCFCLFVGATRPQEEKAATQLGCQSARMADADSSIGSFFGRLGAENLIVDVLKVSVADGPAWRSLEAATRDGTLLNVKQLLVGSLQSVAEQHHDASLAVMQRLRQLGFRQWRRNWRPSGHRLHFINAKFLDGKRLGNSPGASIRQQPRQQQPQQQPRQQQLQELTRAQGWSELDSAMQIDVGRLSEAEAEKLYFAVAQQQHLECPSSRRIGRRDDGGWDICFAPAFDIRRARPCVAFSFGIANIFEYDDLLAKEYKCRVYMFDPSMNVQDHQRTNSSWFYRIGLSSENTQQANGWKMRTLCDLFDEHGFKNRTIDILKIDIEFSEWDSLERALRDGCLRRVKQLLFESHTAELLRKQSDYRRFLRVFFDLFRLGFRSWKWHLNPQSAMYNGHGTRIRRACCYEHYLVNTAFLSG